MQGSAVLVPRPLCEQVPVGSRFQVLRARHRRADFFFESMPRFQVPPPLRGFRGSEVSEVIWTLKLIGTVTELGRWRVPRDTVGRAW